MAIILVFRVLQKSFRYADLMLKKTSLRVYSRQESLLVHLLWPGPNTMLIFLFGAFRFHTALFASEPETVNKTTRVLKVIHSLVHPFNRLRVHLEADSVRLFGVHPIAIAVFTPAQNIHTKGGKQTWVRFNRTKQDRCEYTLIINVEYIFVETNTLGLFFRILCRIKCSKEQHFN